MKWNSAMHSSVATAQWLVGLSVLSGLMGCAGTPEGRPDPSAPRPNIVLIVADDLGYGDLGCYGQDRIKTPFLDLMAGEGMRFTQHYAASPTGAASRCALLTGKHSGTATIRNDAPTVLMKDDELTVARLLRQQGYATACLGKWGVGHPPPPDDPLQAGFDHFFGYLSRYHASNGYPEFLWRNSAKTPLRNQVVRPESFNPPAQRQFVGTASKREDYAQDLFTLEAINWIEQQQQPFFLMLCYTLPAANPQAGTVEVPDLGGYRETDWPEAEQAKAAAISYLDRDIGRIIAALRRQGIDKKTLVLFTSDNGPHADGGVNPNYLDSTGPLRGHKGQLYEGGIRVPLIARWPGTISPDTVSDHLSGGWDLLPTIAELVGLRKIDEIDGHSLMATLRGKYASQKKHRYLYWETGWEDPSELSQAVRIDNWKAVRPKADMPVELYNLLSDPHERINLADSYRGRVRTAERIMRRYRPDVE